MPAFLQPESFVGNAHEVARGLAWVLTHSPATPHAFMPPTSGTAPNGLPIFSWTQAAAQLTRDGNSWSNALNTPTTVTYAFRSTAPGDMPEDTAGFSRFSETQIAVTEEALQLWSEVANITFTRVGSGTSGEGAYSNAATMLFGNYSSGLDGASAFAYYPGSTASSNVAGDVWVNVSIADNANPIFGAFGPHVLAHEIGHAIGIAHPADYDATDDTDPTYENSAVYWQDARMFTIMSYFGSSNTGGSLNAFAAGPQLHDIAAAQRLYGANTTTRTGDTIYGFNSNTGHQHFTITADGQSPVFAVWDAGGNDTIDLSGYTTRVEIDLREEAFSSAGPGNGGTGIAVGNIAIAQGAVIENAIGGAGNDIIIGNAADNVLDGRLGADTLNGGTGADTLSGGADNDFYIVDDAGDTVIENADEGTDTVQASVGVAALAANVEHLVLTGAAVTGNGNALANAITGNAQNNFINGMAGADAMSGGLGNDTYFVDEASDVVSEASGQGTDIVFAAVSVAALWQNVENLTLSGSALSVNGNSLGNVLTGNAQSNTLNGGAGEDTLIGGFGSDTYIYNSAGDVITENAGEGINDTVIAFIDVSALTANVEHVTLAGAALSATGNDLNNILTGNANANTLSGGQGNDQLNGALGADTLSGGLGDDSYLVENAGDVVIEAASEGNDVVYAWVTVAGLADNVERATLIGAGDLDITANGLANRLWGNAQSNVISGLGGEDVIGGLGGDDVLIGGGGRDLLTGGAGADAFVLLSIADSGVTGAARDIINDFAQGADLIDLSAIDADALAGGDQAFAFIGASAFSGAAGQLRYELIDNASGTDYTIVAMDIDGDGIADSQITLVGLISLSSADFLL